MANARHWLIAYDIANARRLQRLHYRLRKRAVFVQESVAVLRASKEELHALLDSLREHIDPRTDDLRAYRVEWPDGAWLSGPGARSQLLFTTAPLPNPSHRRNLGRPAKPLGLLQRLLQRKGN